MYIHIGLDKMIESEEIVGVFDLDTSTVSHVTRNYLSQHEKNGCVEAVCNDLPKSFILTAAADGGEKIYITQLSSQTIIKRIH
ncbi:MAG: DUF370 domain-containing protein [Clostridiales bacterium]|nr:DUF370 domain-containing protein [Clostridiales bacterium]